MTKDYEFIASEEYSSAYEEMTETEQEEFTSKLLELLHENCVWFDD